MPWWEGGQDRSRRVCQDQSKRSHEYSVVDDARQIKVTLNEQPQRCKPINGGSYNKNTPRDVPDS